MSQLPQAILDEDIRLDLDELSRSLCCEVELIITLVHEGALEPQGESPDNWRFAAAALARARRAVRLAHDLEINPPGVALALQLLDRIGRLEMALARSGRAAGDDT
ncbi:MAG: chaperone modulator CbpM [Burkholderiaceae bacterium]